MTIALGINCYDGIVLCTDSLENDGDSQRYVSKIWSYQVAKEWGISIAGAGESDLIDSFTDTFQDLLNQNDFDESRTLLHLKKAIQQTRRTYPDGQLAMVVGLFSIPRRLARLFRVADQSEHVGPVRRYQSIGIASQLANFFFAQLYTSSLSVEEGIRLGVFITSISKQHVVGCGGPTAALSYTRDEQIWMEKSRQQLDAIENEFLPMNLRFALLNYWTSNNPPQKYPTLPNLPEAGRARKMVVGRFPDKKGKK